MESAALGRDESTASMLRGVRAPDADAQLLRARLVQARFEALAEWGIPLGDAVDLAQAVTVDIVEIVGLLQRGCPAGLVLEILS